jgi:hypothetical protein
MVSLAAVMSWKPPQSVSASASYQLHGFRQRDDTCTVLSSWLPDLIPHYIDDSRDSYHIYTFPIKLYHSWSLSPVSQEETAQERFIRARILCHGRSLSIASSSSKTPAGIGRILLELQTAQTSSSESHQSQELHRRSSGTLYRH